MELTVARHAVAADPQTGLSPLQAALLECPQWIRIADAPTGAGKSYAFQYGMAHHNLRVLFIVPTRRLAQNLATGLIRDLQVNAGWPAATASAKVAVWSSDATQALRAAGVTSISGQRLRELKALDYSQEGGEMIVAIPESVSGLLLRKRLDQGQAGTGIFELLSHFDHIVFDEFHSIEPRGFGLAALCARLAVAVTADGGRFSRAKVSFLSATPLAIQPVLERLGIAATDVAVLRETVTSEGRPLHGDVRLTFSETARLADLVATQQPVIAATVAANRQVVLIYNKLGDLKRELPALAGTLAACGVSPEQVLVINSIDDSGSGQVTTAGFRAGRHRDPDQFAVLIATASVEMGLTFRAGDVVFMEPGFSPLNFVQRYGRAARRGADGQVWVRHDAALCNRHAWLRQLLAWTAQQDGQTVTIAALTAVLSRSVQDQFQPALEPTSPLYFGTLPNRAAFAAGLYWNALMQHRSSRGHRFTHLREQQPAPAKSVYGWLRQVRQMEQDRQFGRAAKDWCDRFEAQAYTLRDIGARLRVIAGNGHSVEVGQLWLRRETDLLERMPLVVGQDGQEELRLPPDRQLDDYLLEERNTVQAMRQVFFPHTSQPAVLVDDAALVENWCRNLHDSGGLESLAWEDYPEAMAAAERLVRCSGLVPGDDEELSMAASSGVF